MAILKKALNKANFLDFISDFKQQILNLGSVPYDKDVYEYALHFFSILNKKLGGYNMDNVSFLIEKFEPSLHMLRLIELKKCMNNKLRIHSNGTITLNNIFLFNNHISLSDYQQGNAQPLIQIKIHDCLVKNRNEILDIIDNLQYDVSRPSRIILKVAGYNYQNKR